jgi:hypothetical protein
MRRPADFDRSGTTVADSFLNPCVHDCSATVFRVSVFRVSVLIRTGLIH